MVRNKGLSLYSITEIIKKKMNFKKNYSHQKNHNQKIELTLQHEYILTFSNLKIPPEIKIGYTQAKGEKYIPNSRCCNC